MPAKNAASCGRSATRSAPGILRVLPLDGPLTVFETKCTILHAELAVLVVEFLPALSVLEPLAELGAGDKAVYEARDAETRVHDVIILRMAAHVRGGSVLAASAGATGASVSDAWRE